MTKNIKLLLLLFVISFLNLALSGSGKNTYDDIYKDAWESYYKGEYEKTEKVADKYIKLNQKNNERWYILLLSVYVEKDKYKEILNIIENIEPKVEKLYIESKKKGTTKKQAKYESIDFLYIQMISAKAYANYYFENWKEALDDLLLISDRNQSPTFFSFIARCYYKLGDLNNALVYKKRSFELFEENDILKDDAAYGIAVINALMGNVDEVIKWLERPIKRDRNYILIEIDNNEDFDGIRNNPKFKKFIENQKKIIENQI